MLLFTLFSCKSDDDDVAFTPENIYENCCSTTPVERYFGPGKVYIPNMFTPNDDGINDLFYVQADDGIEMIEVFRITDEDGNVLHENFSIFPNNIIYSWYPYDRDTDTATHKGVFNYYIEVKNINDDVFEITGSACSYVCDESNPFDDFTNCAYSMNHNGDGEFDPTVPSQEPDCP